MLIRSSCTRKTPPQATPPRYILAPSNRRSMPLPAHPFHASIFPCKSRQQTLRSGKSRRCNSNFHAADCRAKCKFWACASTWACRRVTRSLGGGSYQEELISASIHSFPICLGARADRLGERGANPYLMLFSQQRCQGYLLLSCKRDGCAGFRTWEMLRLQSWLWAMRELCALLLGFWGVVLMWSDIALASCS